MKLQLQVEIYGQVVAAADDLEADENKWPSLTINTTSGARRKTVNYQRINVRVISR